MELLGSKHATTDGLPQFYLVNRFAFAEAARRTYERARATVEESSDRTLTVHTWEIGGVPYVAVVGDFPQETTRNMLVRLFSVGEPTDITREMLYQLNNFQRE